MCSWLRGRGVVKFKVRKFYRLWMIFFLKKVCGEFAVNWLKYPCLKIEWVWWWSHLVVVFHYIYIYMFMSLHVHDYVMNFYFMVILRSTTGPYGRPIAEVAYGEILFSLYWGCMGVELGKSGWGVDMMSPMLDIPGSTPVWAHCILFSGFLYYKKIKNKYIYMVFKSILWIYIWFSNLYFE